MNVAMEIERLRGLFPPIPTPFDEQERLAVHRLRSNLKRWRACGFSGFVVLGSTGEFVHLNEGERLRVLSAAREALPDDILLIGGCSLHSLRDTMAYIHAAAGEGVDAVLVNTPCYYPQASEPSQLAAYYRRLADQAPVPILLYNVPQFTGVSIPPHLVAELAEHPNIIGIKESSGNLRVLTEIARLVPSDFVVLTGSASTFYPALLIGAQGGILAAACVAWEACRGIFDAVQSGQLTKARHLQMQLLPLIEAITTRWGIGGLKAAMDLRGLYGGPPRAPLPSVGESARAEIEHLFTHSGLFSPLEL